MRQTEPVGVQSALFTLFCEFERAQDCIANSRLSKLFPMTWKIFKLGKLT